MDPRALLRHLPDPVVVIDRNARLMWANEPAEATFGWSVGELTGQPVERLCHPDDLATAMASLVTVQEKSLGTPLEIRVRNRAGVFRAFEVRGRDASDDPGIGGVILVLRDVTHRDRWTLAGGDRDLYRAILDHAPAITMVLDPAGRLGGASRALTALLGHDLETALGRHLHELVTREDAPTVEAELALAMAAPGQRTFEAAFTSVDGGRTRPMSLTVVNLLDNHAVNGLVVSAVDITELAESRAKLQHQAHHDPLTGLPNRAAFTDRLHQALAAARRRYASVTVIYCDLDGFKEINDRHGHVAGDHILTVVADRLIGVTRAGDTVARMHGDEFVILLEDSDAVAIGSLLSRIRTSVSGAVELPSGEKVAVSVTAGAAMATDASDVDALLARADTAMYSAKRTQRRQ